MSKHPQNGPTFSKAPLKKRRLVTDEQRAAWLDRQEAELEEKKREAAKSRAFSKLVNQVGLYRALFPKNG